MSRSSRRDLRGSSTRLPDETDEYESRLHLKFALEAEGEWRQLVSDLAKVEAMGSFLDYAARAVPFYRRRFSSSRVHPLDLASLPVVSREDHAVRYDQFLAAVPGARDTRLGAFTNGTIGPQLRVQFDRAAWYELNYGTYAAVAAVIPGLLARMAAGEAGVFLITDALFQPRMSLYIPTLNGALLRQLIIGRSEREDRLVVEYLRAASLPLLYGKPSNLVQLSALDAATPLREGRIRPFAVLVSGESLYEDQRKKLEDRFDGSVLNAYIATEGGLIAIECPQRTGLHVRSDFVRAEVLDTGGAIRDRGRGEILITNLFNRAQVFLRYRLGDEVELAHGRCACGFTGPTIVRLLGRECSRFLSPVQEEPASAFAQFLVGLPLKEFQVCQRGRDRPMLKWVPEDRGVETMGRMHHALHAWLQEKGWQDWIDLVPLAAITPRGGKQRRFIRSAA
jgi:phenylacetate-coenzyme A ligase PaaK-like adenylate-forming protein